MQPTPGAGELGDHPLLAGIEFRAAQGLADAAFADLVAATAVRPGDQIALFGQRADSGVASGVVFVEHRFAAAAAREGWLRDQGHALEREGVA